MQNQAKIKVCGQVQGVFFRWSTQRLAKDLNLVGWVKNESNNSVILVANGNKQDIEKLINWCKHGPKFARVNKIEVVWEKPKQGFKDFDIKF